MFKSSGTKFYVLNVGSWESSDIGFSSRVEFFVYILTIVVPIVLQNLQLMRCWQLNLNGAAMQLLNSALNPSNWISIKCNPLGSHIVYL